MTKFIRRLQKIGSSILVSLPKEWVEANELDKSNEVELETSDNTISIIAGKTERPSKEVVISYPLPQDENIVANITGAYLLGYDIIAHRGYPVYSSSNPKINPDGISPTEYFTVFNKYTVELRYPFSTNASSTIYGLAFFEAANGWYSLKEYNPFKLRRSVGVGMRFFLPMFGLLGFDYGIGLDRYDQTTGIKGAAKFTFMLGQEAE